MIIFDKHHQKNFQGPVIGVIKPHQQLTDEQVKRFFTAKFDARLMALFSRPQPFSRISIRSADGKKIVYPYNLQAYKWAAETQQEDEALRTMTPVRA